MSTSSTSSSPPPEADPDDPLCITEDDREHFKESETKKRAASDEPDSSTKKQKTDEMSDSNIESNDSGHVDATAPDSQQPQPRDDEEEKESKSSDEADETPKDDDESEKEVEESEESITKKDKRDTQERKVQNLRKNIKDVLDESHLDATTLAAQRLESERLARVQEQQRLIRETQRQMAAEKQSNKTQQKVLSLLQGESSDPHASSAIDLDDPLLEKFTLGSSLNITPAAKAALQSIQSLISTEDQIPDTSESDDDDVVIQPDESLDKSKAVVVDSSSDSDDCIILSDEEEEEDDDDDNNSGEHTNDAYNQRDSEGRVVVNIGHGEKESNIYVAPQIARVIKPHQIGGVRFLFDNIIESIELFDKSTGFGCILAHSMGLGKTLQLVCFCDIFLRHTNSKSILIIMPINTLQNWLHEFNMWLPLPEDAEKSPLAADGEVRPRQFKIFVLNDSQKTLNARAKTVLEWSKEGGVLMMGYEIYRLLSLKKLKPNKKRGTFGGLVDSGISSNEDQKMFDDINSALVNPGPDLIVCDEGHRIKNAHASTSLALKQIKSKRRIVLTGYPLQNNLLEYWCMVDFVRPSYLGTKTEFSNMFERPILNGQCIDSTPQDCKLMRYRAHVLHALLKGFVQRRSHTVLQKSLPTKTEFVLLVRMTAFQRKLYNVFMDEVVRSKKVPNPLKAFSVCCKIWNHPDVLYNFLKKREELDLDIEIDDAESIGKKETLASIKKRGRKAKPSTKKELEKEKVEPKDELEPIKLEPKPSSEPFKSLLKPPSNDSAYSSNQSMSNSFDSSSGSFNSNSQYQNFEGNSYQNYNYNNSGSNGYQNWNGDNNYWQNNYYPNDYSQNYYQQNSYSNYYGNSNYQSFDQKPSLPKVEPTEDKTLPTVLNAPSNRKNDGGLLADVIKEETRELLKKDSKELKDEAETKEIVATRSSRDDGIPYDWAVDLMKDYVSDLMENSPKIEIFFCILEESIKLGDRLLVFSQSLLTLNLLERFLQRAKIPDTDSNWARNVSYFRLDGSTAALEREKLINEFNANSKVKLFLVSTRAGSLGINLVGANRVVVFDASWNPCHDTQAVCRVYRYGQEKSCYVYRFVMDNCLEKKIYDRQINKQGMADRVVDECNPDAHLSMREVTSLCYDDGVDPEVSDFKEKIDKYEDLVAIKILELHAKSLTKEPFQHESLLVDRKEKKLSIAEKRLAQRSYEMEKQAATKPAFNYNSVGTNYRAYRTPDGSIVHRPVASVRPMRSDFGENISTTARPNNPRPNRWVPVEVWQSKGLTAQEMTLPQDVSIQTNAADKSKIYLKAGQKVIVLKSPKGICLQLESGKVIAIRASVKGGQQNPGFEQKLGSFSEGSQPSNFRPNFPPRSVGDVIDISNDDDDDPSPRSRDASLTPKTQLQLENLKVTSSESSSSKPVETPADTVYKEKVVYKPNLVPRKPKLPATQAAPTKDIQPIKPYEPAFHSQRRPTPPTWNARKNYPTSVLPSASSFGSTNGGAKPQATHLIAPSDSAPTPPSMSRDQPVDTSAFHLPPGDPASYAPQHYNEQNVYHSTSYPNPNYPQAHGSSGYNYPYPSSYITPPSSYHYPHQAANVPYDPNYSQDYNSSSYNAQQSFPAQASAEPPAQAPYPTQSSNFNQWNYNGQ